MSQLEQIAAFAQSKTRDPNSAFTDLDVTVTIRRSLAGLFDLGILSVVLVSLLRTYGILKSRVYVGLPSPPAPLHSLMPRSWTFQIWYLKPAPLFLFVAIAIAYFSVFEASLGWTPGKLLFGIRVVDFYGGTPTVGQALTRNVFRILDSYPYVIPNLVGIAIVLSNRRRQRGGDKAAGTLVVDRSACAAIKAVRRWQRERAMAEMTLPEEVWT